jgi:CAAX prenyl protease-like protein
LARTSPYVVPFAVFILFLALNPYILVSQWARLAIELALFVTVSRGPLSVLPSRPLLSSLLGVAVFVIWIGPDLLFPHYRQSVLFSNFLTGHITPSTTEAQKHDWMFLAPRVLVSVVAVPVLEELFWRGFLLRVTSFWIVAALFASEHGPYWDVGLVAGVLYNWWMLRTGNLADCILAHAVTNACLAAFVIGGGHWGYWL